MINMSSEDYNQDIIKLNYKAILFIFGIVATYLLIFILLEKNFGDTGFHVGFLLGVIMTSIFLLTLYSIIPKIQGEIFK